MPTPSPAGGGAAPPDPPTSFVASDLRRIVVVSGATGKVERYLTPPHGPSESWLEALTLSEDRTWVYFTRGIGRGAGTYRVPLAGGAVVRVSAVPGIRLAVSADGSRIANGFLTDRSYVVVQDLTAKTMRVWSTPGRAWIAQLSWHPDGRHLAVLLALPSGGSELRVLDSDHGTPFTRFGPAPGPISSLTVARLLRVRDRGCQVSIVRYQPRQRRLAVMEHCGTPEHGKLRLLYLHLSTGKVQARPLVLDWRRFGRMNHIDFDASGRHLLLAVGPADQVAPSTVWRWDSTGPPVQIAAGYHQIAW
jgi:hypothetical protein